MASNTITHYTLHESIKSFNLETVQNVFENDPASLNLLDPSIGWSVLYKAIVYEQFEIARFLLEVGADPNLTNKIGETPLHYAVEIEKIDLVQLLMSFNADPNIKQSDGNTPFNLACKKNHTDFIKLMLKYNVDVNTQNKLGKTPLHFASANENVEVYELLLRHKANPDIRDKWGRKPKALVVLPEKEQEESTEDTIDLSNFCQEKSIDKSMKEEDLTDKENMPNEGQNRSIKRRLSFKKYKLTKKKESNDENQFTASNKSKAEDKVLGDVTNVMSSRQEECWSMQNSMRNEYYGNKANEFIENKPQHRVITVKSKVLKSLQTVPRPLAPSTLHDVKNEKLMNSGIQIEEKKMNQSQVPQSKVEMKVQQELKESFSEIMKMSEKINENCLDQEPNTQITRPTLTTKTQPDLPIEKIPVPIQHKTPTSLVKDSDFCSAGKIFNNKLFNIFCHPSPKKEDDLEFREVESKYEIYPTEPEEIIQEEEISIGEWLSGIGLESLKLNFVDNGYANYDKFKKDYESCKAIFQDLLYRFGIDKIGHRARIAIKLKEDCGLFRRKGLFMNNSNYHKVEYPSVQSWLTELGYEEYVESFLDNGYDKLEYIILQTSFQECVFDEFLMRDSIGIKNKQIRDDILKRLRNINEVISETENGHFDSDIVFKLVCNRDDQNNKQCSIF